jgi:hypothetical protein
VIGVEHRIKRGTAEAVEAIRHKAHAASVLNTAYIERLNGTFRQCLAALARRGRALARQITTLEAGMWVVGTLSNFCTPHQSLRVTLMSAAGVREQIERTPAMAAGISDHCWSVKELLSSRLLR